MNFCKNKYKIEINGLESLKEAFDSSRVLFHGVNKSGSGAVARTLREGFIAKGIGNTFLSPYFGFPKQSDFSRFIEFTRPPVFLLDHYLYKSFSDHDFQRFSMIRNPLSRILSVYGWLKKGYTKQGKDVSDFTLEKFIASTKRKKHLQYVQFAVGYSEGYKESIFNMSPDSLLEMAVTNVEKDFIMIGTASLMEEMLFIILDLYGIDTIEDWMPDERNVDRPALATLDQNMIDYIKFEHKNEFKFYEYVSSKFENRLRNLEFLGDFFEYKKNCAKFHRSDK
jgi:hypothetical protein